MMSTGLLQQKYIFHLFSLFHTFGCVYDKDLFNSAPILAHWLMQSSKNLYVHTTDCWERLHRLPWQPIIKQEVNFFVSPSDLYWWKYRAAITSYSYMWGTNVCIWDIGETSACMYIRTLEPSPTINMSNGHWIALQIWDVLMIYYYSRNPIFTCALRLGDWECE